MLSHADAAALEALLDDVPAPVLADVRARLERDGLLAPERWEALRAELVARAYGRSVRWAAVTVTQGGVLDAFATHCADELDDVEVVGADAATLTVRWREETSRFLVRNGALALERFVDGPPLLVLGEFGEDADTVVAAFLDDVRLRETVAVCDLARLERIGAVRSSAFVYFEWFLRDAYGVKLLPASAFTMGLIQRGILSLGMG